MVNMLSVFYFILLSGLVAGIIWILVLFYRKEDIPSDYSIVVNYMCEWCSGHFEGIIIEEIKGKKRDGIVYIPRDVDYVKYFREKNKDKIPKEIIWFEKHQRVDRPRGTLSSHRNYVIIHPKMPQDLNELDKRTKEGKLMMEDIADRNTEKTIQDILRTEAIRTKNIAKEFAGAESLGDDFVEFLKAKVKDAIDIAGREREPKSPPAYTPPRPPGT